MLRFLWRGDDLSGETAVSHWRVEREHWTSFYERQLRQQLQQAVAYAHSHTRQITTLKQHFDSFFTLLGRARSHPALHPLYIELLTALHPWPIRWGKWDVWEAELRHALPILAAFNQSALQAEFLTYLAEIQFQTGRLETAVATGQRAVDLAWHSRALVPWGMAGSQTVLVINRLGRNEEARHLLAELERQWSQAGFRADAVERLEAAGHLLLRRMIFLRHDGRTLEAAERAGALIEQLRPLPQADRRLLAALYKDRATMLWAADQYEAAEASLLEAIALYAEMGDLYAETTARGNLGLVHWSMARLPEAEAGIRQSLNLSETLNARWRMMNEMGNLCAVSFSQGKIIQALQYTERHLKLAQEADDAAEINRALGNRALSYLYLGRYADALPDIETSIGQLQGLGLQQQLAETYVHLSFCLYGLGRRAEAETAVAQARAMAEELDAPMLNCLVFRGRALFAADNREAMALVEQALALTRSSRRRLDEARCLLRLALLSDVEGERVEFWRAGEAILREIGAEEWVNGRSLENPPTLALVL
jgi:tetratricopeptide (TPR) repeat protein